MLQTTPLIKVLELYCSIRGLGPLNDNKFTALVDDIDYTIDKKTTPESLCVAEGDDLVIFLLESTAQRASVQPDFLQGETEGIITVVVKAGTTDKQPWRTKCLVVGFRVRFRIVVAQRLVRSYATLSLSLCTTDFRVCRPRC
jgi:hypothetical protein